MYNIMNYLLNAAGFGLLIFGAGVINYKTNLIIDLYKNIETVNNVSLLRVKYYRGKTITDLISNTKYCSNDKTHYLGYIGVASSPAPYNETFKKIINNYNYTGNLLNDIRGCYETQSVNNINYLYIYAVDGAIKYAHINKNELPLLAIHHMVGFIGEFCAIFGAILFIGSFII